MAFFKSFEELDCWKIATELRRELSDVVKGFPGEEKFLLTDQIKRASRSVTNNIAEGFGRYHYQEFIQFCRAARGSLYELCDHILIARDEGYVSEKIAHRIEEKLNKNKAVLNGFIKYLQKIKDTPNKVNESEVSYELLSESTNQQINESTI